MGKLNTLIKSIKTAQAILDGIDSFVDVDRLIHISNAQGPQAKVLRALLELKPEDDDDDQTIMDLFFAEAERQGILQPKAKSSKKLSSKKTKRLPAKSSPSNI